LSNSPITTITPQNWMSALPDTEKLSQMSIPGTHDSMTYTWIAKITPLVSAQDLPLMDQLNDGIRFLDIRLGELAVPFVGVGLTSDLECVHTLPLFMTFSQVLTTCKDFLDTHPRETIIMAVQNSAELILPNPVPYTMPDAPFAQIANDLMAASGAKFYTGDKIPELKDARGKIVILRRYNTGGVTPVPQGIPATDNWSRKVNPNLDVQDYSKPNRDLPNEHLGRIELKWKVILDNLTRARKESFRGNTWFINFTSASEGRHGPRAFADEENPKLADYLRTVQAPVGTIMMDFPAPDLIDEIIRHNFEEKLSGSAGVNEVIPYGGASVAEFKGDLAVAWSSIKGGDLYVQTLSVGSKKGAPINLNAKSNKTPALAVDPQNGNLILAWTSPDGRLNVERSSDGIRWTDKFTSNFGGLAGPVNGKYAMSAPALAAYGGRIYLAWSNDGRLYVTSTPDGNQWQWETPFNLSWVNGASAPALAVDPVNGNIILACTDGNGRINVMSSFDGVNWITPGPIGGRATIVAPALAVYNRWIYLAWTGTDGRLNVMSSPDGNNQIWSAAPPLPETSGAPDKDAPTLAVVNGRLYLGWVGPDRSLNLTWYFPTGMAP
jgi:1-phosphatidylinositol phosphodiesterase